MRDKQDYSEELPEKKEQSNKLEIKFSIKSRINKPVAEVYNAVADPDILSSYFTTSSSGAIEAGEVISWHWGSEKTDITVLEAVPNKTITFRWEAYNVSYETVVEIDFQSKDEHTIITISESGWNENQEGLNSSYNHCSGWQHMLTCMKGRLEFGVDLRPDYK